MKKAIQTSIRIPQAVEKVWKVLMTVTSYPIWSPTLRPLAEFPAVGQHLKIVLMQPNGFKITMKPVILIKEDYTELRWRGSLFIRGLFDGEHYFRLTKIDENTTELTQGENFSGLLVPFLKKMIEQDTLEGFKLFNQALKEEVERI